jgi:two-component system sensor histidine kinase YesM
MRVNIYADNSTIVYEDFFISQMTMQVREQPWFEPVMAGKGAIVLYGPFKNAAGENSVILGRNLSVSNNRINIVMTIEIPDSVFKMISKESNLQDGVYLMTSSGTILFSRNEKAVGQNFFELYPNSIAKNKTIQNAVKTGDEFVFLDYLSPNRSTSRLLLANTVHEELINSKVAKFILLPCVIFSVGILLSVLIIVLFVNRICKRIYSITEGMACVENGNYDITVPVIGKDELAELCGDFNNMTNKIYVLINEQHTAEQRLRMFEYKKKEAELLSLQSQIDPHFLVNFMEAIRVRLIRDGNQPVANILLNFTKLLRRSIDWHTDRVTISNELAVVEEYLELQVFRYREKIAYDIQCDEDLKEAVIPKFLIQPLVENSICHGIENIVGQGRISIQIYRYDDKHLIITVEDNGAGIEPECLCQLREQMAEHEMVNFSVNVGMLNVSQRIRLFYGDQYGMEIFSELENGTRVQMCLPISIPKREEVMVTFKHKD